MQPVPVKKVIERLWQHNEQQLQLNVYAILDAARHSAIYRTLGNFGSEYLCLYKNIIPEELAKVAPYIVQLEPDTAYADWLIRHGWGNSWGIFVISPLDLFEAAIHFRRFIKVLDETGNTLYFRYYDPRIMRVYLPTCNKSELEFVFGKTRAFIIEGQAGKGGTVFSFNRSELRSKNFEM